MDKIEFTKDGWQECKTLDQLLDWHLGVVSEWAFDSTSASLAQRADSIATNLKLRLEKEKQDRTSGGPTLDAIELMKHALGPGRANVDA